MSFSKIKFNPVVKQEVKSENTDVEHAGNEMYSPNKMPPQKPTDFRNTHVRVFGKRLIPVVVDLANRNVYPDFNV